MTTKREVRVGIVGSGYIAGVHSAAYRTVAGTYPDLGIRPVLRVATDVDRGRAEALASAWGWERVSTDWTEVIRAADVDIVDICVPNFLHAEIAVDALSHGKHVICEKPMALNLAEAQVMADAAASSELIAQVCMYYRLWPAIAWCRDLIRSGALGTLRYLRGWMLQDYAADPAHSLGWRSNPELAGSGALGDLGTHILDIARSLCGGISAVNASTLQFIDRVEPIALEDLAVMTLRFDGGVTGVVEASWALRGHKCDLGFDVVGDQGALRFSWERSNQVEVLDGEPSDPDNGFRRVLIGGSQPDVGRFVAVPGQGIGYRDCFAIGISQVLRAIASGSRNAEPTFAEGLAAALAVDAAQRSARTGTWERLGRAEQGSAP